MPGVCRNGSVPLSHSGNVVTRTGIYTHCQSVSCSHSVNTSSQPIIIIMVSRGRVVQWVGHPARKSGVLDSIPGLATYFCFSFRFFKKGSCQLLVNRLGGLSLPRKSVVRLTDRPDMTLDVYRGHKTTMQQQQHYG